MLAMKGWLDGLLAFKLQIGSELPRSGIWPIFQRKLPEWNLAESSG